MHYFELLELTCNYRNRCQPQLSLPQPVVSTINSAPVFSKTRTIIPDGALFVPTERFDKLCRSERSAFKLLSNSPLVNNAASHGGRSSFRSQSTLCWTLPEEDCFEVAGVFWEDKKPALGELKAAYRQNRMSTAASLRQLHFLKVKTPVFGLIFSEGTVQAHMDWWAENKTQGFVSDTVGKLRLEYSQVSRSASFRRPTLIPQVPFMNGTSAGPPTLSLYICTFGISTSGLPTDSPHEWRPASNASRVA